MLLVCCLPKQDLAEPEEASQGWTGPMEMRVSGEQMDGHIDGRMHGCLNG